MKIKGIFQKLLFFVISAILLSNFILAYIVYRGYESIFKEAKNYLPEGFYTTLTLRLSDTWLIVGLTLFFVILVSVFFVVLFSVSILRPLYELLDAFLKVKKGQLETGVEIKTGDEFEKLGNEFNMMVSELKKARTELEEEKESLQIKVNARTRALAELAASLEKKVKERTRELELKNQEIEKRSRELEEKIEELNKFHKLSIGREMKMVEMKEKIRLMEEEIKRLKTKAGEI